MQAGDNVTLHYQGTSWDTGEVFDQSYGGDPAQFTTDAVIQGFGAALVGQKVGTKLIVTIPPQYAYGTDAAAASSPARRSCSSSRSSTRRLRPTRE